MENDGPGLWAVGSLESFVVVGEYIARQTSWDGCIDSVLNLLFVQSVVWKVVFCDSWFQLFKKFSWVAGVGRVQGMDPIQRGFFANEGMVCIVPCNEVAMRGGV